MIKRCPIRIVGARKHVAGAYQLQMLSSVHNVNFARKQNSQSRPAMHILNPSYKQRGMSGVKTPQLSQSTCRPKEKACKKQLTALKVFAAQASVLLSCGLCLVGSVSRKASVFLNCKLPTPLSPHFCEDGSVMKHVHAVGYSCCAAFYFCIVKAFCHSIFRRILIYSRLRLFCGTKRHTLSLCTLRVLRALCALCDFGGFVLPGFRRVALVNRLIPSMAREHTVKMSVKILSVSRIGGLSTAQGTLKLSF